MVGLETRCAGAPPEASWSHPTAGFRASRSLPETASGTIPSRPAQWRCPCGTAKKLTLTWVTLAGSPTAFESSTWLPSLGLAVSLSMTFWPIQSRSAADALGDGNTQASDEHKHALERKTENHRRQRSREIGAQTAWRTPPNQKPERAGSAKSPEPGRGTDWLLPLPSNAGHFSRFARSSTTEQVHWPSQAAGAGQGPPLRRVGRPGSARSKGQVQQFAERWYPDAPLSASSPAARRVAVLGQAVAEGQGRL